MRSGSARPTNPRLDLWAAPGRRQAGRHTRSNTRSRSESSARRTSGVAQSGTRSKERADSGAACGERFATTMPAGPAAFSKGSAGHRFGSAFHSCRPLRKGVDPRWRTSRLRRSWRRLVDAETAAGREGQAALDDRGGTAGRRPPCFVRTSSAPILDRCGGLNRGTGCAVTQSWVRPSQSRRHGCCQPTTLAATSNCRRPRAGCSSIAAGGNRTSHLFSS